VSVFNINTRLVLSYDVLRQRKTGVMTGGGALRRPVVRTTNDGRRVECSTLAAVR